MQLIIVESPSKAKTIEKYLGGKYKVDASGGHVRDLPEKRLGVNIAKNYEPNYVITADKKPVIKRLKEKVEKADKIYLATDPDREGEAISWHLQEVLGLKDKAQRIEFNEISEKAVKEASNYDADEIEIVNVTNMEEAVAVARERSTKGDIVSLSPASASFGLYKNFEERGNHFKSIVNALK